MSQISEKEYEKLAECLKQIKNEQLRDGIADTVVNLYQTLETLELSEVFRRVLKTNNLDESIADGVAEDKKPFLKLPANVRYGLLSTGSGCYVEGVQDMRNQERRKSNIESDETLLYTLKRGSKLFEARVMRFAVWVGFWDECGKYEYEHKKSEVLTEKFLKAMLKHDKDGDYKLGFSNYLARCEATEKEAITIKYTNLCKKYFAEDEQ